MVEKSRTFFLAAPCGMWGLSSLTMAPAVEAQCLTHWTAREVQSSTS